MDRYSQFEEVGHGRFGVVHKAIDNFTHQIVAIKILRQSCNPSEYLPELRALSILQHPRIVSFKGLERPYGAVWLVFEYMQEGSLRDLINQRLHQNIPFLEYEIQSLMFQVLQGLEFMHHQRRFMHRDLKPENLLMNDQGYIKIADLGTATEIHYSLSRIHHHYVTTRWYRAPEMLLRALVEPKEDQPFVYDEKVDMWAMGAIMAELYTRRPLFLGVHSSSQLEEICKVIGAPTSWESWMGGIMPNELQPENGCGFRALMPHASDSAIDLIQSLCSWNPAKRPSAAQALHRPFFNRFLKVETSRTMNYNIVPNKIDQVIKHVANVMSLLESYLYKLLNY